MSKDGGKSKEEQNMHEEMTDKNANGKQQQTKTQTRHQKREESFIDLIF